MSLLKSKEPTKYETEAGDLGTVKSLALGERQIKAGQVQPAAERHRPPQAR